MKNIKCVIEARMGSKRLPGKSMMNLLENYKLIDYTIQSALNSNFLSNKNIYLLTSKNLNNLKLIKYVKKSGAKKIIVENTRTKQGKKLAKKLNEINGVTAVCRPEKQ